MNSIEGDKEQMRREMTRLITKFPHLILWLFVQLSNTKISMIVRIEITVSNSLQYDRSSRIVLDTSIWIRIVEHLSTFNWNDNDNTKLPVGKSQLTLWKHFLHSFPLFTKLIYEMRTSKVWCSIGNDHPVQMVFAMKFCWLYFSSHLWLCLLKYIICRD